METFWFVVRVVLSVFAISYRQTYFVIFFFQRLEFKLFVTVDYYKLNHVVAPVEAAVSDVFILEQITQILHMICSYVSGKCFFSLFL